MSFSSQSEDMIDLLLKHYPMTTANAQLDHSEHKKPQQHMHDYRKEREIYEKTTKEKLENMTFFKQEGNNHYKNLRFSQAMYFYQKVIIYGDYTFPDQEDENSQMEVLLQQANCNMALCLIKFDRWEEARVNLSESIKGKNIGIKSKGYYWLTKLYLRKGDFQNAKESIKQIELLGSQYQKLVLELSEQMQKCEETQLEKSKSACRNMFNAGV